MKVMGVFLDPYVRPLCFLQLDRCAEHTEATYRLCKLLWIGIDLEQSSYNVEQIP